MKGLTPMLLLTLLGVGEGLIATVSTKTTVESKQLTETDPAWVPRIGEPNQLMQLGECGQVDHVSPISLHRIECPKKQ